MVDAGPEPTYEEKMMFSDIFIHTLAWVIFGGFKILNFNFLGAFQQKRFFGDEGFVDIFGGHHKIGLYLGVISMHFKILNIFWGCLIFLIFWRE